ncbi:MAG: M23 family metallopeptidase [Ilumatobacteraceae bacterium]
MALLLAPVGLRTTPSFSVPFPCGQTWIGATRTSHRPPQAIDFNRVDDRGAAVVASEHGTVEMVEAAHESYGGLVVVDHGDRWQTYSAHLETITVAEGEEVERGDVIGTVGSTGRSDGAHLHYEQRLDGRPMRTVFHARETPSRVTRPYTTAAC